MNPALILSTVAAYVGLLFWIAWRADHPGRKSVAAPARRRIWVYGLSLAVYCTAWTFYGAVGAALRTGWDYLPIYAGPIIMTVLGFPLWRRIASAAKAQNIGSIADFIAARYGKRRGLGAFVSVVCILASLPYIALQLKSLSMSWAMIAHGDPGAPAEATVLSFAVVLAGFAMLFGARRPNLAQSNPGLVRAIAFESGVKLAALVLAAGFAVYLLTRPALTGAAAPILPPLTLTPAFLTLCGLAGLSVICLPRQFHIGFVELGDLSQIEGARKVFPLYLALTAAVVIPIAAASSHVFAHPAASGDLFVLALPLAHGQDGLGLIVFLGGFSASAAMVIVETVALSAMASNELILPFASALTPSRFEGAGDLGRRVVMIRRLSIAVIVLLAWVYFVGLDHSASLTQMGLIAFAGAAQLAPAVIGGVYWRRGHALGVYGGLGLGFLIWLVSIGAPSLIPRPGPALEVWIHGGESFFNIKGLDPYTRSALVSLSVNVAAYIGLSKLARPSLIDRIQASAFTDRRAPFIPSTAAAPWTGTVADLRDLIAKFLGEASARQALQDFSAEAGRRLKDSAAVDTQLARAAEKWLAGVVGAPSARGVLAAALVRPDQSPSDVLTLLDEAALAVHFTRETLQAALDNISQGVSVVDRNLRLIAWNQAYLNLFDFPAGLIHIGRPIADVVRYNAERGEWGPGDPETHVQKRLEHLRRGQAYGFERLRAGGQMLKMEGAALPGGGYVTTYTDITADKALEAQLRASAAALEDANAQLEARVLRRTAELAAATDLAERATQAKTRFLAAASHDLLQPLHAARLFVAALAEDLKHSDAVAAELADKADRSIDAADRLLRALLNLSKLEAGGVQPHIAPMALAGLFAELEAEFAPVAAERGLRLTFAPTQLWVDSDPDLLRSVLQNLIGNALRYTKVGGVLIGARRREAHVQIEVYDTGPGVPLEQQTEIFREFTRLEGGSATDGGMGLGLAIVERVASLLGCRIALASIVGSGSRFSVLAPRAEPGAEVADTPRPAVKALKLRVLCVDDEPAILDSLTALLTRWGAEVVPAASAEAALKQKGRFDVALVDYRLRGRRSGLDLIKALGPRAGKAALVTADIDDVASLEATALGVKVLKKPLEPLRLRVFLGGVRKLK